MQRAHRPQRSARRRLRDAPEVAPDGRSIALVLAREVHPAPGAVTTTAAGEIVPLVASEKATATGEETLLVAGTTLEAGPFSFELEEVGPSEWSETWSISLKTEVDLAQVIRFALVDAAGEEVELSQGSSWSGMGQWSQSLECERTFERAALRIEYWSDPRVERVPFDLQADVGLR